MGEGKRKAKCRIGGPSDIREEERQTRKTVEDEKRIMEEGSLRNMDRLNEEKEALLQ